MAKQPSISAYVDEDERELIEALEADDTEFVSRLTPERKAEIETAARATLDRERTKITIRIRNSDLSRLKARAEKEGMPYQTLINSILHKAVNN